MKIAATIQARMTSTRLPGKVLLPVAGKPLLVHMIERLRRMETIDDVVVATTVNAEDDPIAETAKSLGAGVFRGSEHDVLERVVLACRAHKIDLIVETTADCPLIDPEVSDQVVRKYLEGGYDYVSNVLKRTFPRGMDTQVFPTRILEEVHRLTTDPVDREHVSYYIYQHPEKYRLGNITAPPLCDMPDLRLTVDTPEDFTLIKTIFEALSPKNPAFSLEDIMRHLHAHPHLFDINREIKQKTVTYGA